MGKQSSRFIAVLMLLFFVSVFASACSKSSSHGTEGELIEGGMLRDQDLETEQRRFGEGNIPYASESSAFPDVHFGFDSSVVISSDTEILRENARKLAADRSLYVELEGHCDKRGTAEYNLALGEERAKSVATLLVNYGVSADRISTISYGEEIPLDPRDTEDAYAKNRRVHFAVYRKTGGAGR